MAMKHEVENEEFSGLRELDRIVSQVLEAVRGPESAVKPVRRGPGSANVIYNEEWREAPAPSADIPEIEAAPEDESGVEPEEFGDYDSSSHDWEEAAEEGNDDGALTEAERAFVDQTTRWLQRRENRDIILNAIWRKLLPPLAEDDPESTASGGRQDGEIGDDGDPVEPES